MVKAALILFAVLILATWGAYGMNPIETIGAAINELDDKISRGQRLTEQTPSVATVRREMIYVDQTPAELCQQAGERLTERAGVPVTVTERSYTMARVIRSERSTGGPAAEAIAIAWVLLNVANKSFGGDVLAAATAQTGKYGPQGIRGSRFATSADPYESDYTIALAVLTGEIPDITQGACNFLHPKGFKTTERYQEVRASWIAKNLKPVAIDGAPMIEVYT
jgi:hypothetical protein